MPPPRTRLLTTVILLALVPGIPARGEEPIKLTGSLWKEYAFNELAADQKWAGKVVTFQAQAEWVGKSSDGRYYIAMQVVRSVTKGVELAPNMICYLSPDALNEAAKIKDASPFTLTGKVKGRVADPAAFNGYRVELIECTVVVSPEK